MTSNRKLKIRVLSAIFLSIAGLTVLAALAQQAGTGQSAKPSVVAMPQMSGAKQWPAQQEVASQQRNTSASAHALERGLPPEAMKGGGASVTRAEKNKAGAVPMDGAASFFPVVTYDSGGVYPYSVATGDFNGDGYPDVVVANTYCYSINNPCVSVLLNRGDGTFQPAVDYPTAGGGNPWSVAVADVNGDGKPDIVVANSSNGTVGVLLGKGDGTFHPVVTYSSGGTSPEYVAVADVNGDGKLDLLVANWCASADCGTDGVVGVLLGNGDGTFQPTQTYDSGAPGATWVVVADVNGDGKPDVVVVNNNDGPTFIGILLGNGDGTFQTAATFNLGEPGYGMVVADVNGDGKPDLIVSGYVMFGNGDGTFQPPVQVDRYDPAFSVAVVDVNGDGKPDLVWAGGYEGQLGIVGVQLRNGDGTFQTPVNYDSGGYQPRGVAVADVNGDGKPDLVVVNYCATSVFPCPVDGTLGVLVNSTNTNTTTTAVVSSLSPSVFGQTVTFTAQVTSAAGSPTGTVEFFDGSTQVGSGTLTNGSVSLSISSLPVGANSMTAKYQGGAGFASSTSAPLTQTVTLATTTTALASSLNPAATNQPVTFTATVASQFGGAATGSVVFSSGSQTLGTGSLVGNVATLTTSFATPGTYSISAKYSGDGNNAGSTSATLSQVIIAATTTVLASSLNPSLVGQAVTFTANVTSTAGSPPNGENVTFKNGSAVLGTAALSGGVAPLTTSSLPAGIFTITASYPGDANFAASTSPGLRQVVNSTTKSATAITLTSSLNPSIYGQSVSWTATVTTSGSVMPMGTVNFTWGESIGLATINASGVATLTKSNLNADAYPLRAVYGGDANNLGSTSPVLNQVVQPTTSAAALGSSPNPSVQGQSVTFTATISSPTVTPTGPVTFTAGKTVLGTGQLSKGKAKFTISTLPVGSTVVTATYYGDSNIAKSSASVTQTVQ